MDLLKVTKLQESKARVSLETTHSREAGWHRLCDFGPVT